MTDLEQRLVRVAFHRYTLCRAAEGMLDEGGVRTIYEQIRGA